MGLLFGICCNFTPDCPFFPVVTVFEKPVSLAFCPYILQDADFLSFSRFEDQNQRKKRIFVSESSNKQRYEQTLSDRHTEFRKNP